MTATPQTRVAEAPARQHHNLTLLVLVLAAIAYSLQQTLVAPALPAIQVELDTSTTAVTYILTGFLLSASVATPVLGRLGDMFGKKRLMTWSLAVFAAGSLVCALSTSIEMLITGRVVQGAGAAVFPLAFGIIRDEFPRERVAGGIGLISATFGIGGGLGVVLSGPIVDNLSYEWIFWLGLVVILAAMVMTHLFIPDSPVTARAKVDWGGAALMSSGLVALLVGVSQGNAWGWSDVRILALFAAAAVLLGGWVAFEHGHPMPLVDMAMMRERTVLTTNLAGVLIGFGMFASFILIPAFVQTPPDAGYGFGASVTQAGLYMLPSTMIMLVAGPLAGWMCGRYGSRLPLLLGTMIAALAFAFFALEHSDPWSVYVLSALSGIGIGFCFAAMANLIVEAVEPSRTGVATGMNTIMRTIGGAIGGQIAAAILTAHVMASGRPSERGFVVAFAMLAVALGVGVLLVLAIPNRRPGAAMAVAVPAVGAEPVPVGASSVRGQVRRANGDGVAAAVLTVIDGAGREAARARADSDGEYAIALPPGHYVVLATDGGRDPGIARVEVNGRPAELDLTLPGPRVPALI